MIQICFPNENDIDSYENFIGNSHKICVFLFLLKLKRILLHMTIMDLKKLQWKSENVTKDYGTLKEERK